MPSSQCFESKKSVEYDSDGDICFIESSAHDSKIALTIKHSHSTPLCFVGKQIWRGSLLLSDFILHNDFLKDAYCLELGCGVGLSGIISSIKAKHTFCTDISDEILSVAMKTLT